VRDTIARQSDVDKDSIKVRTLNLAPKSYRIGVITFAAKKGKINRSSKAAGGHSRHASLREDPIGRELFGDYCGRDDGCW